MVSEAIIAMKNKSVVSVEAVRNYRLQHRFWRQAQQNSLIYCIICGALGEVLKLCLLCSGSAPQGTVPVPFVTVFSAQYLHQCWRLLNLGQLLHFPPELQFHLSNRLPAGLDKKLKFYLFKTESTSFPSAPITVPGSSVRIIYLNEWHHKNTRLSKPQP